MWRINKSRPYIHTKLYLGEYIFFFKNLVNVIFINKNAKFIRSFPYVNVIFF
jgi:hypothetical protein